MRDNSHGGASAGPLQESGIWPAAAARGGENAVSGEVQTRPSQSAVQKSDARKPAAVTAPRPVTTTRRRSPSSSLLTPLPMFPLTISAPLAAPRVRCVTTPSDVDEWLCRLSKTLLR